MDNVQIQQVEQTVRFQHPEKLLTTVPRLDEPVIVSFIRIKALFLKKCATLLRAFSGWVFSDNVA